MTLLEPWVMIRIAVGLVAALLFGYGAWVGVRILRFAHVEIATEGQLLLERQSELAGTFVRIAAVVSVFSCVLSAITADRLSGSLKGAMCGYGVVMQNRYGWPSLGSTLLVGLAAGVLLQMLALDRYVRSLDLMRPLAAACIVVAALALVDFGLVVAWLTHLDLAATASCCSTNLADVAREPARFLDGPRVLSSWGAGLGIPLAI